MCKRTAASSRASRLLTARQAGVLLLGGLVSMKSHNKLRFTRVALVVFLGSVLLLSGCGLLESGNNQGVQARLEPAVRATVPVDAQWGDIGKEITKARSMMAPLDHALPPTLSQPMDIASPGDYQVVAKGIVATMDSRVRAVSLPASAGDFFQGTPDIARATIAESGSGTIRVTIPLHVTSVTQPAYDVQMWLQ